MPKGIWKTHNAIGYMLAISDYNQVVNYLHENEMKEKIVNAKGKHWHKVENATALMLDKIENAKDEIIDLNRPITYYLDEILEEAKKENPI